MENGVGSGYGVGEGTGVTIGSGVCTTCVGEAVASAGVTAGEQARKSGSEKRMQSAVAAMRLEGIMR